MKKELLHHFIWLFLYLLVLFIQSVHSLIYKSFCIKCENSFFSVCQQITRETPKVFRSTQQRNCRCSWNACFKWNCISALMPRSASAQAIVFGTDVVKIFICVVQKLYKEDWENEKDLIYYPVHITPGYEHALEASKFQSPVCIYCLLHVHLLC